MLKLIKTDFSISGRTLILVLIYTLIFPILFRYSAYMSTVGALSVYIFVLGLFAAEERDRVNLLYKIMPVRAEDIVGAKYIECVLVWAIATVINVIVIFVMTKNSMITEQVNYADNILSSFVTMGIVASVTLPFVYKYGYTRSRIPIMFIWIGLAFATPMTASVMGYLSEEAGFPTTAVLAAGAVIAAAVMAVSARISVGIYKKE